MNVTNGIDLIRNILDEPKYEYFGSSSDLDTIFRDALREAATIVARECWYRGEKEALRPQWAETVLTLDANQMGVMPVPFLFIESVRSNYQIQSNKQWPHKYVSPAVFSRRRHRTPFETASGNQFNGRNRFLGRAEYTIIGSNIYATSNTLSVTPNKNITVSYITVPTIPLQSANQLPLAAYMHPVICDKAAEILYRKEHPGDDRQAVGGIIDVEAALYKAMRDQKQ
jgi:hypothetical protein